MTMFAETDHVLLCREHINTIWKFSGSPQHHHLFIVVSLSAIPSMNTRKKNKSAHPGIPDMTAPQLSLAGLSRPAVAHRPPSKRLNKDQQITALKDELRAVQELVANVTHFTLCCVYYDILITLSFFRTILTRTQNVMVRHMPHKTQVVTLTPRRTPRRPL
jgi:hypothetical protein